jgi:GT2 family glycosyltransferase
MLPSPLVSIILVSWNSAEHLPRCLDSLSQQTFRNFEIIVVDNGSSDQGLDARQQNYLELDLRIERLASNQGFAVANNIGARLARGKWLALLNADAFPRPDWLEKLLHAAYRRPEFSFFSSRQLQFAQPDILDGAGDEYHISGLAWRRFYNHPAQQYG